MCLFIVSSSMVFAQITGFVNDNSNVLTPSEEAQISSVLQNLYNNHIAQIAIVTVDSLDGQPIEKVAFDLADGELGEKDNGMLLLIAVKDKQYRFEVGRGLEPIFNDAKVGRYGRDYLVPAFQEGQYGQGISLVVNEISKELTGKDSGIVLSQEQYTTSVQKVKIIVFFFFFILFIFSFLSALLSKREDDKYFWAAVIGSQMLRGGRGSSGGLGGFGGFGGGSFGGGGASGGW